eukprot:UN31346
MPLTCFESKRNIMENSDVRTTRRRGIIETLEHHLSEDLLTIAESQERREDGFYEEYWHPILKWFNEKFGTDFEMQFANMKSTSENQTFFESLIGKEPQDVFNEFQGFMKDMRARNKGDHTVSGRAIVAAPEKSGAFRKWLRVQPDLKLLIMDELLAYFPSSILIAA